VVIAAFVTEYGRIELYNYIKDLDERLLYVDTDSLVFIGEGPSVGQGLLVVPVLRLTGVSYQNQ
jgi:hypothetical protein